MPMRFPTKVALTINRNDGSGLEWLTAGRGDQDKADHFRFGQKPPTR
jgi:hypothetical protein